MHAVNGTLPRPRLRQRPSKSTPSEAKRLAALIFGLLVSTLFTLVVVPMIYYMAYAKRFGPAA